MSNISTKNFIKDEYIIHRNMINLAARSFNNHPMGLAEWLKNSIDAYTADNINKEEHNVIFSFNLNTNPYFVECIDFVGMENRDIEEGLKVWGDPEASKRGHNIDTYGGHGNGGKLYMLNMFKNSYFITYKKGLLNVFGFNENKDYGYYAVDHTELYKDRIMEPEEALYFAEINNNIIPPDIKNRIINKDRGFTVVRGIIPNNLSNKKDFSKIINIFSNHPQAKRIFNHSNVSVIFNNQLEYEKMMPEYPEPHPDVPGPYKIEIPEFISSEDNEEKFPTFNSKYSQGKLTLKTAKDPIHKKKERNKIEILARKGVLASHQINKMPVEVYPYVDYIYGECELPILESDGGKFINNDRSDLIKSPFTEALLIWISKEIDKIARKIEDIDQDKQKEKQKSLNSKSNERFNDWMNKNIENVLSEVLSGLGDSDYSDEQGGGGGQKGSNITSPPNGFDFKYPISEVLINTESNITLKVSIPDPLPIAAVIRVSSNSKVISLNKKQYTITSEDIKKTFDGQQVAFIKVAVQGDEKGEATIFAKAGYLSASTKVEVVTKKKGNTGKQKIQVLLSSINKDPLGLVNNSEGVLYLTKREPVIYQRSQDFNARIYWINTSSPLASQIKNIHTFESDVGKNFLFERYVDIFVQEGIQEINRIDYENFTADNVYNKISEITSKVHSLAVESLNNFLLGE